MYIEIGTIIGIIFLAIIIILGIKSHLDNKDIERKREEEKRLEEEKRIIWRKNQEEKEQMEKEYRTKEIVAIMNCSVERAKTYLQALSDYFLLSEFDSWESVVECKREVINEATGYHECFIKELLPIIQKNNYELTERDIGFSKKYFFGKNFSLIANEAKLKMLNEFDYELPRENDKILLETIKADIASKITNRSAMALSPNLSQEDFDDIVIDFAEKFGFVFTTTRPCNKLWGDPYKYDYEMLEAIWVQSLLSSQNKDDLNEDFFKYSELFFDAVYYDIRDYKNVLKKIEEIEE